MNFFEISLISICALSQTVLAFLFFGYRKMKVYADTGWTRLSQLQESLDQAAEDLSKYKERYLQEQDSLVQVRSARDKYKEMYLLHFEQNRSFEQQRTAIWELYRLSGLQAGNAQALLFGELQQAMMALNAYREKAGLQPVQLRSELKQIVEEFSKQHGANRSEELEVVQHGR